MPVESKCLPLHHHHCACSNGNGSRDDKPEHANHRLNRQLYRLSTNEDCVIARQLSKCESPQGQKSSVQNQKCDHSKCRGGGPLKALCFPEHIRVSKRPEPEGIHIIGKYDPAAKNG